MKFVLPFLLSACLWLSPRQAHADNVLTSTISTANDMVKIVLVIAKKHQNDINKGRMLPLVSTLQDEAESLSLTNRTLESSIVRAFQNTKPSETVKDQYANQVIANADIVNQGNVRLLNSLAAIQTYLKTLDLQDAQGKRLNADQNNLQSRISIIQKMSRIEDIEKSFGPGRGPLTTKSKTETTGWMKEALGKIDSVVNNTRDIYDALNR